MTERKEAEAIFENPQDIIEPSNRSKAYMRGVHQEALKLDPDEKALRDKAKDVLLQRMTGTLSRHGIGVLKKVESEKTKDEFEKVARETPIIPYPLSKDEIIGVKLTEELAVIQRFDKGIYVGEEPVVGKIHLTEHDIETGEQIGRNSAGVLGSDFVTNATKGQATRQQIEGISETVLYIDRYLSGGLISEIDQTGLDDRSVIESTTFPSNGDVPREV